MGCLSSCILWSKVNTAEFFKLSGVLEKRACTLELKKDMRSKRTWDRTGQNETDVERFFKSIASGALWLRWVLELSRENCETHIHKVVLDSVVCRISAEIKGHTSHHCTEYSRGLVQYVGGKDNSTCISCPFGSSRNLSCCEFAQRSKQDKWAHFCGHHQGAGCVRSSNRSSALFWDLYSVTFNTYLGRQVCFRCLYQGGRNYNIKLPIPLR